MLVSQLAEKLFRLQTALIVLYAVSLPFSLTASWVIFVLGVALWLLQIILTPDRWRAELSTLARTPLLVPLAVFACALFVSGLANGGLSEAFISLINLKTLIVFPWAFHILARHKVVKQVAVQALIIVGALSGVFGAVQQLCNFHPFGYRYLQATGFLANPMAYAGQMQLVSMLALGILLAGGNKEFSWGMARKPVFVLLVVANVAGVLFAGERNAWLGAIAGIMSMTALLSWRALAKCCLALAVVSVLCWVIVPVVHTRIAQLGAWQQDISVRVRLEIWQESIKIWRSKPLVGVGIRNYPHFNIPEAIVPGHSKDINHAHSNYLHILATTGALGLASYLWLWIAALKYIITALGAKKNSTDGERSLCLGILGGTVALLVAGLFEYNFGTAQVRLAQWFIIAMLPPPAPHHNCQTKTSDLTAGEV